MARTHEQLCYMSEEFTIDRPGLCICDRLRKSWRDGYNAHAAAVQHWQDTHGAYRQHGGGENP